MPPDATLEIIRQSVVALAQDRYGGVNHTDLTELLAERDGVMLSRPTVRRIQVLAGLTSPRHLRLEDREPRLTLLLAVANAAGTVPYALIQEQEDTRGYLSLLQGIIERKGVPMCRLSTPA